MHPRLALHSLSSATWPLERDLDLYGELGVTQAGFFLDKLLAAGADRAVELIRAAGVGATQICCAGPTTHDPARWPEDRARLRQALEIADALGAPWVGCTTGPAGPLLWEDAAAALGESLRPVVEAARSRRIGVAIEQTLPVRVEIGFVHSFRDTAELARRFGLGVVMETNYCSVERDIEHSIEAAADVVAIVQLSDLVPPSTVIPDRAVPGDGALPLERIVRLLVTSGYRGPFELEMLGPRIEAEGYAAACRRAVSAADRILTAAGA